MQIESIRFTDEPERHRPSHELPPPGLVRAPDHDVSDAVRARKIEQHRRRISSLQPDHLATELACEIKITLKVSNGHLIAIEPSIGRGLGRIKACVLHQWPRMIGNLSDKRLTLLAELQIRYDQKNVYAD